MIRADPDRAGLLYAGTENGAYVSFDDGGAWAPLEGNLPQTPITDLAVKEQDLIAATQGRGIWILDDLTLLHQLTDAVRKAPVHLFQPRPSYRLRGGRSENPQDMGTNPHPGTTIHYLLAEAPDAEAEVKLEILDSAGEVIRTLTRKPGPDEKADSDGDDDDDAAGDAVLEAKAGLNRFSWDLRYPGARRFPGLVLWNSSLDGPTAVPGSYRARLTVGDWSGETDFEVLPDPRVTATADDYRAQFDFLIAVRDEVTSVHEAIGDARAIKQQLGALEKRLKDREGLEDVVEAAAALKQKLTEAEEILYQTKMKSRQDPLNYPIRLNDKLAGLLRLGALGDFRPTDQLEAVRAELSAAIDAQLTALQTVIDEELPAFNAMMREREIDLVAVP